MKVALTYALLCMTTAGVIFAIGPIQRDIQIVQAGAMTSGHVTALNCSNHGSFWYAFTVGDREFGGSGNQGTEKPCGALVPGDRVIVSYLQSDPTVSVGGNPTDALRAELITLAILSLLLPAFILLLIQKLAQECLPWPSTKRAERSH